MTCSDWPHTIQNIAFMTMIVLIVWLNTREKK